MTNQKELFQSWIIPVLVILFFWGENLFLTISERGITVKVIFSVAVLGGVIWVLQFMVMGVVMVLALTFATLLPKRKDGESTGIYVLSAARKIIVGIVVFFVVGFVLHIILPTPNPNEPPICLPPPAGCQ